MKPAVWMALGAIVALAAVSFFPQERLLAVATDRQENFAMATGSVDAGVEAIFTLDFLSCDLHGAVLNPGTRTFTTGYHRNIAADLGIEAGKNPKFVMVTGQSYLRTGSNFSLAPCALYIAELNSGKMAVYTFAFSPTTLSKPTMNAGEFVLLQVVPIRSLAIR
jgi:hypothetical protein